MNLVKKRYKKTKKQFINGISDEDIMTEIIRQLTGIKDNNNIISKQVLCWAKWVDAQ